MVDQINVTTSKGQNFFVGGSCGNPTQMKVESGDLVGWDGFCLPELIVGFAPTFRCKYDGRTT